KAPAASLYRRTTDILAVSRHCVGRTGARVEPGRSRGSDLQVQVALDQIVLLQPAQALLDLACPDGAHSLDRLELAQRSTRERLETVDLADEPADDRRR